MLVAFLRTAWSPARRRKHRQSSSRFDLMSPVDGPGSAAGRLITSAWTGMPPRSDSRSNGRTSWRVGRARGRRNDRCRTGGPFPYPPNGAAGSPSTAQILLGLNGGFGAADCSARPKTSFDRPGWIEFRRPKTRSPRRFPLWPETQAALEVQPVLGREQRFQVPVRKAPRCTVTMPSTRRGSGDHPPVCPGVGVPRGVSFR